VDLVATVVPDKQPLEVSDPAVPQLSAVLVVVVAAVGGHELGGSAARPTDAASHGREASGIPGRVDQEMVQRMPTAFVVKERVPSFRSSSSDFTGCE